MTHPKDSHAAKNTAAGDGTTDPRLVEALRHSLLLNEQLKQRNQDLTQAAHEPIAIISMGCRLPGGIHSPEQLWQQLSTDEDAIGPFPADRGWNVKTLFEQNPALSAVAKAWKGGFLEDAAGFDAGFFKISDREALAMDPQQRLLLEVSWEILERAGIVPATLKNSQTGVFIGSTHNGYLSDIERRNPAADGYRLQGSLSSISSGRIAYALGLNGPAITVDTACSASLTAIHQAIRSLKSGECSLAIAGGATIMASPEVFAEFTRQSGLAADGRCKAFSDHADGTGFSEGVGLILLEKLSDALRAGHSVLAVIRGSAINQDGASNGLTAPNGPAQEQVIRQALNNAELTFSDIDVVEAHGTGTTLGDPIEAHALLNTYGKHRSDDQPLWLGSLKSNIGHTQLAAGVASVIKMVMALRHGRLPKTLHAETPSGKIDWSRGNIKLLNTARNWPDTGRPKRAAVSSFGFSGTNAHLILEEAPSISPPVQEAAPARTFPVPGIALPLAAASPDGLCAQAKQLHTWLTQNASSMPDIAFSLATTRTHFNYRAVITAEDSNNALIALEALAANRYAPGIIQGVRSPSGNVAFLFTGQGAQWPTMGQGLYHQSPVFAHTFDDICQHLDPLLSQPLKTVIFAEQDSADALLLDRTDFTQAALFAFEVALCRTVMHLGVQPDVLIGHSIGEIAAAHIAGVFNLADAATFVATRGRLMESITADGAMVAIEASEAEILPSLQKYKECIAIAAINSPSSVVISGDTDKVLSLAEQWHARGYRTHRLRTSHAFHSPHIDGIVDTLRRTLSTLSLQAPAIPIVSTVTGQQLTNEQACSVEYWANQARSAVRFDAAIQWLEAHNIVVALEVGPDGVLTALGRASIVGESSGVPSAAWIAPLRKGRDELRPFFAALARLYTQGQPLDWRKLLVQTPIVPLPTYPFQHRRYWLQAPPVRPTLDGGFFAVKHPFLHAGIDNAAQQSWIFTGQLDAARQPWILEHRVADIPAGAGTMTAEMILSIGEQVGCQRLDDLFLHAILPLNECIPTSIQLHVSPPEADGGRTVEAYFHQPGDPEPREYQMAPWKRYATCRLVPDEKLSPEWPDFHNDNWPPADAKPVDFTPIYEHLAAQGVILGNAFQRLINVWEHEDGLYIEATSPESHAELGEDFILHPTLLDAGMQAALLEQLKPGEENIQPRLLFSLSGIRQYIRGAQRLRGHLVRKTTEPSTSGYSEYALRLADDTGRAAAIIDSIVLKSSNSPRLAPSRPPFYRLAWREIAPDSSTTKPKIHWIVPQNRLRERLSRLIKEHYASCTYDDMHQALATFSPQPDEIAVFIAPDGDDTPEFIDHNPTHCVLNALQTWIDEPRTADVPLLIVTQGAIATNDGENVPNLAQSPLWGLVRTAQLEYPGRFYLLDINEVENTALSSIHTAINTLSHEPQLALREGKILTPRLVKAAGNGDLTDYNHADQPENPSRNLNPDGTVLITGGTGALGKVIAKHLVEHHGVRHVLLASRRGKDAPGANALLKDLAELGAQATIVACDIANVAAVASLLDTIPTAHPLTAVIHTAGSVDTATLKTMSAEQIDNVLQSKAVSAWNLHQLTQHHDLAAFILYSSAVSILAQKGQGNYAAANAFLDALAYHRRHQGLPATAMAWGMWAERSEMGEQLGDDDIQHIIATGQIPLSRPQGLAYLDTVVGAQVVNHPPLLIPARLNLEALREQGDTPLLAEVLPVRTAARNSVSASPQIANMPEKERLPYLLNVIIQYAGEVLSHPDPESIRSDVEFITLGFDSLTSVEMGSRLSQTFGVRIPATAIFDHSTPQALAQFLLNILTGEKHATAAEAHIDIKKDADRFYHLLRQAVQQNMTQEGLSVLAGAARLREHFSHRQHEQHAPETVWLRNDQEKPLLVCLNSFIPAAANLTYQRLSSALSDRYSILTVPLPGYHGEPLPGTDYAAAAALATAIERGTSGRDFTLVGFSTGGLVAHAAAHQLEARGRQPKAVVLIDSFPPSAMNEATMGDVLRTWFAAKGEFWSDEDTSVMAMAWYLELFGRQWTPSHLKTPTLLLQAKDYPASAQPERWANEWPNLVKSIITPGSHFELLTEYVAHTAKNLSDLLGETEKKPIRKRSDSARKNRKTEYIKNE
ncbi:type I polyketide synthase [Pectobacterium atrosepticum SCRI1043]|uniref:Type I polyketide synthase n=3 Tax=Pectobacterium atrosepticum TaxID=29471 RepID=Q6D9L2_PECAS|nr:type I polyketide synthase [Pectobacterium atrosepticum]GKV85742.1 polyketide synthase [Pectobacterium carotovorum subsp. carotovorum]AFH56893.1 Cfa7 [Pectobacterium atrosepticum]AIA69933.1 polyketide synthase [Pectobacterium atrosepticum]AIK12850.1 type I polyketide synthase [Pectobacterium atrosepticum]ATY89426.1 polyketide synthase [Pectobacterium atrosepticum]